MREEAKVRPPPSTLVPGAPSTLRAIWGEVLLARVQELTCSPLLLL